MRFPGKTRSTLARAACAAFALLSLLAGCGVEESLDRDPTVVDGIRIDSVRILPFGGRFVLRDSATRILFRKFHPGYVCSEILQLDLEAAPIGDPPALRPKSAVRLPASETCALDSNGRDSTVSHVFGAGLGFIRVANSAGTPTDSAIVVRGTIAYDSLKGAFGSPIPAFSRGRMTVVDSTAGVPRSLTADSLSSCEHLNRAESSPAGDSLKVRLSIVTVDPAESADACLGPIHSETIPLLKGP